MTTTDPRPPIVVRNAQRQLPLDVPVLQRFADRALEQCLRSFPRRRKALEGISEVSVIVVSDRRIASLHQRFMGIAEATDVITFQHGEICISIETAERQAAEFGSALDHELRLYVVHGILHLLRFDDTTHSAARAMGKAQQRILAAGHAW